MASLKIPNQTFAGYIFDCDGTLADSMPLHYKAWSTAFQKHGAKFDFTWELFYSMAGTGLRHSIEILNQRFNDSLDPSAVLKTQHQVMEEHFHTLQPIETVVSLAQEYSEHTPISVASGGGRNHVHITLGIIGVADIFDIVVTQDDVKNSKPAPDLFILAAEKMGVSPRECLVFEDSPLGIEAANRAGMQSVFVDPEVFSQGKSLSHM